MNEVFYNPIHKWNTSMDRANESLALQVVPLVPLAFDLFTSYVT